MNYNDDISLNHTTESSVFETPDSIKPDRDKNSCLQPDAPVIELKNIASDFSRTTIASDQLNSADYEDLSLHSEDPVSKWY